MGVFRCRCGGEAPNCLSCGGTGLVSNPKAPIGRPHRNLGQAAKQQEMETPAKSKKVATTPAKKVDVFGRHTRLGPAQKCPFCNVEFVGGHSCKEGPTLAELLARKMMRKQNASPLSPTPKKLVGCPVCGLMVAKLARHQSKVHGIVSNSVATPTMLLNAENLTVCEVCGARVKNIGSHRRKTGHYAVNAAGGLNPAANVDNRPAARRDTVASAKLACPHCKFKPKNFADLSHHIKVVHINETRWVPAKVLKDSRPPRLRDAHEPSLDKPELKQSMDATHQWGGSFRDHGQFGSYPSHDDMGDESSA